MKLSTLLLFSLVLMCFSSKALAQDSFLSDYKIKWKNAAEYTIAFAKAMPEDYYSYSPTPVEMTFQEQLQHVAGNMIWLSSSYLNGPATQLDPTKAGKSKKETVEMLEKSFAYAAQAIHGLTEKQLNEKVEFVAGEMTRRRILLLLTDHVTHHRGQLVVYLRMKNVVPPKYVGW